MVGLLKKKLADGEVLLGTIVSLPAPEVAELLSLAGFDWLFVDMEHGALDLVNLQHIVQTASPVTPCLIRIPSNEEIWIKKSLDTGAAGIIIPHIKSAEDVKAAVNLSKYPPTGSRSAGIARAHGYGIKFQEYVDHADEDTVLVFQIENIEAVNNIESIVKVPGIDALLIGPFDLSGSMGKLGKIDDADVRQAIATVRETAIKAGLPLGIFAPTADIAKPFIADGFQLVVAGTDTLLLAESAKKTLAVLRG